VTPNYLDNSTSSVAPWCSCAAAGNQREECGEFLGFFTHNTCLRESQNALSLYHGFLELRGFRGVLEVLVVVIVVVVVVDLAFECVPCFVCFRES